MPATASALHLPQLKARPLDGNGEAQAPLQNLLSKRLQTKLAQLADELKFARGESPLYLKGAQAEFVYLVESGIVRVSRLSPAGRRQILAFMFAGSLAGLPDGGRYANSAQAIGPATLYRIPWGRLCTLMQEEPGLQSALFTRLAFDFRQAQRRIVLLSQQNASQKLASFLMELRQVPEFRDKRKACLKLPLSRTDLGDYLGIAPETLTRALAGMEALGILRRKSPQLLHLADIERLQKIARGPRRAPAESAGAAH